MSEEKQAHKYNRILLKLSGEAWQSPAVLVSRRRKPVT